MTTNFEVIKNIVPNQEKTHEIETINSIVSALETNGIVLTSNEDFKEENKQQIIDAMESIAEVYGLFKYTYNHDSIKLLKKNYDNMIEFIYNDSLLPDRTEKNIEVYNDNEKVFEGTVNEFLEINELDKDYLVHILNDDSKVIEFNEVSGNWKIINAS